MPRCQSFRAQGYRRYGSRKDGNRSGKGAKTVAQHSFSGAVEHAIAHIEEAAVHSLPEEQQRWYAIKIFERDEKVLSGLKLDKAVLGHMRT